MIVRDFSKKENLKAAAFRFDIYYKMALEFDDPGVTYQTFYLL